MKKKSDFDEYYDKINKEIDKVPGMNPFKGNKWQPKPTDTPPAAIDAVAAKAAERRQAMAARRGTILDRDALTDRLVALGLASATRHLGLPYASDPFIRKLANYFSVLDLKALIEELEKE